MSRRHWTSLRLATSRLGELPLDAGAAANAAERWGHNGRRRGCVREVLVLNYRLNFLRPARVSEDASTAAAAQAQSSRVM
jgi:hypothetical protein